MATRATQSPLSRAQAGKGRWLALLVLAALAGTAAVLWPRGGGGPGVTELARSNPPAAASLSTKLISSEDLPPQGTRSLFDHLVAQNDGLPYPFEKLVELIQRQDPEGKAPLVLMIPDGRSLLKASANHAHPRVLAAADFQAANNEASLGLAPRGQLFLGFVENANEIEVISYNEAAGRFEFQLVQNYSEKGERRIVYARRAICMTCHQGAAPIFPQRPWSETNGQPETAAKIIEARASDKPYLTAALSVPLEVPERFDQLTDVANFIPVTQRAWIDGCGVDGACRRQMLKLALAYLANPLEFDAQSQEAWALRGLQAKTWPAEGIAEPESDLRNRDPLGERKGIKGTLRGLFAKEIEPGMGAKDNEDLEAFDALPKLPAEQDPLTPRTPRRTLSANDLDGAYGLAALFSDSDRRLLEQAAGYDRARLLAAVDAIEARFFEPAPFMRVATMNALLAALGQAPRNYCCLDTAELSPPMTASVPRVEISAGSPLKDYEQYCFSCHRGNPAKRLNFMAGSTEDEVLANIKATAAIRDALDWARYKGTPQESKMMPPADAPERAELIQALQQNPKLLDEMQAVVPGLFDF